MPSTPRSFPRRDLLRLGGAALAAGTGSLALGSCSRAPNPQSTGGGGGNQFRIYWNAGHVYDSYSKIIEKFGSDHDLEISWQKFQWPDLRTKLLADFSSGNVPDLVEFPPPWMAPFALQGHIRYLDSYAQEDSGYGYPSDFRDEAARGVTVKGQTFGIPLHLTEILLVYNKSMFDKAGVSGPPTTWDEFLDTAEELTGGGQHGCALNQLQYYSWPWLLQNGVSYYEPSSREFLAPRDSAVEALQFQADLVHKHKVSPPPVPSPDPTRPQQLFTAGRVAMIVTGPWDIAPIQEGAPDLDFGVAMPLDHRSQDTPIGGSGVFIPKRAVHPELAWDLIKRLTSRKVEVQVSQNTNMTMPRKSWAQAAPIADAPLLGAFAKGLRHAVDYSNELARAGGFTKIEQAFESAYQDIVIRNKPVAPTLDSFAKTAGDKVGNE